MEFVEWFEKRLGTRRMRELKARSKDLTLAKRAKHEIASIAALYRAQYEAMSEGDAFGNYFGE